MTTFHYIYISNDDALIGAGTFTGTKEELSREVSGAIEQVKYENSLPSDFKFAVIVSETIDFLSEAKESENIKEYLGSLIKRIRIEEIE